MPRKKKASWKKQFKSKMKLIKISEAVDPLKSGIETEISEANELSLYQKRQLIEYAVEERFGKYSYTVETYDTYVVVKVNQNSYSWDENSSLLKVNYSFAEDFKSAVLATDTTPVEKKTEYVEVTEAVKYDIELVEAKKKDGSVYKVRLIKAGLSNNGFNYPAEMLKKSVHLFEGVRAFARSDKDHVDDTQSSTDVNNIVGWYSNPAFEDNSIVAEFNISAAATRMKTMIKDAFDRGKKDIIGLSIVALGTGQRIFNESDGTTYINVESLVRVKSVDTIVNPAAGGEILTMTAAETESINNEESKMLLQKMLKLLEAKFPEHFKKIKDQTNQDEVLTIYTEALEAQETVKPDNGTSSPKIAISEAASDMPVNNQQLLVESQKELVSFKNEVAVEREEIKKRSCALLLAESLVTSDLPNPIKDNIKSRFEGKIFEKADLDSEFAMQKGVLAKMSESGDVRGFGENRATVGLEYRDKVLKGFDGFFMDEDVDKVPRYSSFREAYLEITGDKNFTGNLREAKNLHLFVSEALNSGSWAELLGDSITRKMIKEYKSPGQDGWRRVISDIVPISDFRSNRRMRMGGYGLLPAVGEEGTYQPLTSPTDEEATYSISKRGGLESLTLEMIANDDVGSIRRIPSKLGRAAAITLYRFVFDFILNNAATTYDDVSLFHASHGNLGSTALSAEALRLAKIVMADQAAYNEATNILNIVPRLLLIPNELEDTAFRLTKSKNAIAAITPPVRQGDNEPNLHASYGLEPMVVPYWTDTNDWALICDPRDCPTVEIGFFQGKQDPSIFVQDQPNVGSMFSSDKITYKIRHIYGGAPVDHRGMFKAVVT